MFTTRLFRKRFLKTKFWTLDLSFLLAVFSARCKFSAWTIMATVTTEWLHWHNVSNPEWKEPVSLKQRIGIKMSFTVRRTASSIIACFNYERNVILFYMLFSFGVWSFHVFYFFQRKLYYLFHLTAFVINKYAWVILIVFVLFFVRNLQHSGCGSIIQSYIGGITEIFTLS